MTDHSPAAWVVRAVYTTLVVALVAALTVLGGTGSSGSPRAAGSSGDPVITIDGATVDYSAGPDQALGNAQGCVLDPGSSQVLSFTGGAKQVGFVDGSLGVKSKGNGQDCGQVDGGEALQVDLGPAVTGGSTAYAIGTAVLDPPRLPSDL